MTERDRCQYFSEIFLGGGGGGGASYFTKINRVQLTNVPTVRHGGDHTEHGRETETFSSGLEKKYIN